LKEVPQKDAREDEEADALRSQQAAAVSHLQHAPGDRVDLHPRRAPQLHDLQIAYQLVQKAASADTEVDSKKARSKLGNWVKLHDYNISQKAQVIVEHFRETVATLIDVSVPNHI
jgi:hypothetical protein